MTDYPASQLQNSEQRASTLRAAPTAAGLRLTATGGEGGTRFGSPAPRHGKPGGSAFTYLGALVSFSNMISKRTASEDGVSRGDANASWRGWAGTAMPFPEALPSGGGSWWE